MPGPAYTATKHAVLALTHSFNMDECVNGLRACCLMPRRGRNADPEAAPGGAERGGAGQDAAAGDLGRTIAFVASLPPRVCVNEILISPTMESRIYSDAGERD